MNTIPKKGQKGKGEPTEFKSLGYLSDQIGHDLWPVELDPIGY